MISRRAFIAGSAMSATSLAFLTACGDDSTGTTDDTEPENPDTTTAESDPPTRLAAGFADGYAVERSALVAGIAQRAPFVAVTDIGQVVRSELAPESIDVTVLHNGAEIATYTVARHADGIPTPYYPLEFTPPDAGDYQIAASFATAPTPFRVEARDALTLVQVGEPLRPVDTPTTTDARGVDPICTQPDPCPFHDVTLTEALASGGPVALIISTPGFCQTAICGPVLDLLVEAASDHPELTIVHAEVYVAPTEGDRTTTEIIATYGLDYEPSFYVADAAGIVTARLDFSWDRADLAAALATV